MTPTLIRSFGPTAAFLCWAPATWDKKGADSAEAGESHDCLRHESTARKLVFMHFQFSGPLPIQPDENGQKMGTATDFRSPSLLETKHSDERKSDGSPHFLPGPTSATGCYAPGLARGVVVLPLTDTLPRHSRGFSTVSSFMTENTPETPFACSPAMFLSPSVATTPTSFTSPFFTMM